MNQGTRLVVTLLHHLKHTNKRYGVVSLCIGTGMGSASVFENVGYDRERKSYSNSKDKIDSNNNKNENKDNSNNNSNSSSDSNDGSLNSGSNGESNYIYSRSKL